SFFSQPTTTMAATSPSNDNVWLFRTTPPYEALGQSIESVVRRDSVSLGHGRIIERGAGEITNVVELGRRHDGLPDVHDFRSAFAETMNAQDGQRFGVKQNLEHADLCLGHLRARQTLERSMSHFIRNARGLQFALVFSDGRNLRQRVNA